jgi:hypothetical protein
LNDVKVILFFSGDNCSNEKTMNLNEKRTLSIIKNRSLVYEYVHPIIRLKKPAFSRDAWLEKSPNFFPKLLSERSPPSVILLILDAVSDLQAQRALPRTLSYLKSLGLYTFQRHAIVGDGTFENIVAMLFGQSAENFLIPNVNDSRYEFLTTEIEIDPKTKKQIEVKKIVHYPGPFDNYSFIVKNFSKLGYTTYFSEEWRESAFYNLKNGFRQSPTDFYLRPYWLSLYETLSYDKFLGNSNPKPCYLDKLLHFLSLNWLTQFLQVHHKTSNYPTFGVMKLNEMSHDYLERLFWIDQDLENFFQHLIQERLLDNTILIFCGDHGHRQHHLRLTRIGSFEVKLPFFSILLPQSFKQDFPQAVRNLEKNQESKFYSLERPRFSTSRNCSTLWRNVSPHIKSYISRKNVDVYLSAIVGFTCLLFKLLLPKIKMDERLLLGFVEGGRGETFLLKMVQLLSF